MKNIKKRFSKKERGSALLLTLGILSLALIMGMSFAFSARTSQKAAQVNSDQVKAKLLAESGLQRAMAFVASFCADNGMPYYFSDDTDDFIFKPDETDLNLEGSKTFKVSKDDGLGDINNLNFRQRLATVIQDTPEDDEDERNYMDLASLGNGSLPYLKDTTLAPAYLPVETDGDIIGRVAFVVADETNKLNINELLSLRQRNGKMNLPFVKGDDDSLLAGRMAQLSEDFVTADGDFLYDITYGASDDATETDTAAIGNTVRLGQHPQEIRVNEDYLTSLPEAATSEGTTANPATRIPWFSYEHLRKQLWDDDADLQPDTFRYTFFSGEDIEAYTDKKTDSDDVPNIYQRFDLTGFEWRPTSITGTFYTASGNPDPDKSGWHQGDDNDDKKTLVEKLIGTENRADFYEDLDKVPEEREVAEAPFRDDDGFGIPYLYKIGQAESADVAKQIAACLVDYSDGDSHATIDPDFSLASTAQPKYCGNEKVAYFNEVGLQYEVIKTAGDTDTSPTMDVELYIKPYVEMLDLYDSETGGQIDIRIDMTLNLYRDGTLADTQSWTYSQDDIAQTAANEHSVVDGFAKTKICSVTALPREEIPGATGDDPTTYGYGKFGFQINVTRIVAILKNCAGGTDGRANDVMYWGGSHTFNIGNVPAVGETSATTDTNFMLTDQAVLWTSWESKDCRANHLSDCWEALAINSSDFEDEADQITSNTSLGADKAGSPNTNIVDIKYGPDNDIPDLDGNTYSSAYIRNAPMESLWELGAIHRGKIGYMLDITGSDKEILDQVKIGPLKFVRGKFNLHAANPAALHDLFAGIGMDTAYNGVDKDEDDDFCAPADLEWFMDHYCSPTFSRGDYAEFLAKYAKTCSAATKRQIEALAGRTVGLLTTRLEAFSIVAEGQALKELEDIEASDWDDIKTTIVAPLKWQYKFDGSTSETKYFTILGSQRILAHVVRDTWLNEWQTVQVRQLED